MASIEERRARRQARREARQETAPVEKPEVVEEMSADEPEVEPTPEPTATRRERRQRQPEPEPVEEVDEETVSGFSLDALLLELDEGKSITVTRTGYDTFTISSGAPAPVVAQPAVSGGNGRLPGSFWTNIQTPEYNEWIAEWQQMNYEQKVEFAEKNKVQWDEHDNERVDHMRVTQAVQAWKGIEKYQEPYREAGNFKRAKDNAKAGMAYPYL